MTQLLLHVGDIRFLRKPVSGRHCAHRMHAQPLTSMFRPVACPYFLMTFLQMEFALGHSSSPVRLFSTDRNSRRPLGLRVCRDRANLPALARYLKVNHAPAALQILYLQTAQLFPLHPVIEHRR